MLEEVRMEQMNNFILINTMKKDLNKKEWSWKIPNNSPQYSALIILANKRMFNSLKFKLRKMFNPYKV